MLKSKVVKAHKNTPSLRTTIPQAMCQYLGVKDGDTVEWDFHKVGKGLVVKVRKA